MASDRRQDRGGVRQSSMRDRARKRAEEREGQGGGGTKYNLPENVSFYFPKKHVSLDIIPYTVTEDNHPEGVPKGEMWYQRTIYVHFGVGAEDKSYLCLKTVKKKCPICKHRPQFLRGPNADEEMAKSLKAKERELFNVYDCDDPDKGVQLWDVSSFNFGAKLEEELREGRPEWAAFAEAVDGFTLKVRFSEEQIGKNKFMQASRIDFEERKSIDKKLLSQALDLDKILKVLSYEALEKIFLQVDDENAEELGRRSEGSEGSEQTLEEEPREQSRNGVRDSGRPERGRRREVELGTESVGEEQGSSRSRSIEREKKSETGRGMGGRASKAEEKPKCPAGRTYGKDCEELTECRDCGIWEGCIEEQDRLNAEK